MLANESAAGVLEKPGVLQQAPFRCSVRMLQLRRQRILATL
jgi:hypothetical protein